MTSAPLPTPRIGHVHLKVADLERAVRFYADLLGLEVQATDGRTVAFLSWGSYHHHIALNTWHSEGGTPAPVRHTGLFHVAFLYPTRVELARVVRRMVDAGVPLDGASDHGVSEAIYLSDPDGNGIELYWDRPRAEWPRDADGQLAMYTRRLDLDDLLAN
ncbi:MULTISPECIES: VOC family protein [unclassified Meridianimarinicoccus]|uniref:VOC family protein n=1 Tax=unclassified Meridianimarinicoccus TaxID=2923344 RepID=UPI0018682092|nr:VOC family protein [Fluviibacterium sp. MJW13]